ncbi:MAG: PHP domain-containing protein [Clostridium sp.]|uniref:PHP domain-containing protein n=1 Tax=Clostridium sp. TaxID=1506 RepID=UPI003F2F9730
MKSIDLHMHSSFSDDGELRPEEIIDRAVSSGINIISITDHNSVKANKIAKEYSKDKNIKYISGVEIDCQHKGLNLHLLGYDFDFTKEEFNILEESILREEKDAGIKRMEKIKKVTDLYLDEELVFKKADNGIITGELIAEVLLEDVRNENSKFLKPYRENGSRSDMPYVNFYWDYFSQGKLAYVHIEFISLREAVRLIKESGGIAVLAHPGKNLNNKLDVIDELIELGLDGIEVFSSYHSSKDIKFFYRKCKENNLFISCGTDFHGKNKPNIEIGSFKFDFNGNEIIFNDK